MERNKKTDKYLWNKNNVLGCFSIFSLNFLIIFFGAKCNGTDKLIDRTEWNVMEKPIYITEWNGTEKADIINYFPWNRSNETERPKVVFGIKTIFTVVSQS